MLSINIFFNVQLLEMLSEDFGGRVELSKDYYKALTASVRKHFNGNGVIASMEHCNDFMFLGTEAIALGRVGMYKKIFMIFIRHPINFTPLTLNMVSWHMQGTISGVLIPRAIQTGPFGYKVVIWYTVPIIAYGWETSYNQIGTCFSLLIHVRNFMLPQEPFLEGQFM